MADDKGKDFMKGAVKGLTSAIKSMSKIQQEKAKLQETVLTNRLENAQNYMFDIMGAEAKAKIQTPLEKVKTQNLMEMRRRMLGQGQKTLPRVSPEGPGGLRGTRGAPAGSGLTGATREVTGGMFADPSTRTRYTPTATGGIKEETIDIRNALYNALTKKERLGKPLNAQEQATKERLAGELGVGPETLTPSRERDVRLNKQRALETLNRGSYYSEDEGRMKPFENRQEATDFIMDNLPDIDLNDPEIQEALSKYRQVEPRVDEPGFFETLFGQKYPTMEKYGYTWEKREDGKWHRVGE